MIEKISAAQARRIALAAQGIGAKRAPSNGIRQLDLIAHRIGLLQLDSVNVFERSHYLPVFSRLGPYDKALLDRLTFGRKARYTEYWAHVAAIIPTETWPLWRWKMREVRDKYESTPDNWIHRNRDMLDWLLAQLAAKGPQAASTIEHDANRRRGGWWEWSDVKLGLEFLFEMGEVVTAGRTRFERTYALPEQAIPAQLLDVEVSKHDAVKQLLAAASLAHGVGTVGDLADYYRIPRLTAQPILAELAEEGVVIPVAVDGWERSGKPMTAYLHAAARIPRRIEATTVLSPFDPVVWERDRALRMFGFHYRIEIYTPAPKRIFGYYTLPLLVDDRLVGRIDLKNDRQNRVLRVQSAWIEAGVPQEVGAIANLDRIVAHLREIADWQNLGRIAVADWGDLAGPLASALS